MTTALDAPDPGEEERARLLSDHASTQVQLLMAALLDRSGLAGDASAIMDGAVHGFCAVAYQLREQFPHPDLPSLESIIHGQVSLYLADIRSTIAMGAPTAGRA